MVVTWLRQGKVTLNRRGGGGRDDVWKRRGGAVVGGGGEGRTGEMSLEGLGGERGQEGAGEQSSTFARSLFLV